MSKDEALSPEEIAVRKQITKDRQLAVDDAWEREMKLVLLGKGTRDWTPEEQKELLETGRVWGYQGHHMKSVSCFPEEARNPDNIQFLTDEEHIEAHVCFRYATNGYYDVESGEMHYFGEGGLEPAPVCDLSEPYVATEEWKAEFDEEKDKLHEEWQEYYASIKDQAKENGLDYLDDYEPQANKETEETTAEESQETDDYTPEEVQETEDETEDYTPEEAQETENPTEDYTPEEVQETENGTEDYTLEEGQETESGGVDYSEGDAGMDYE